MEAKNNSMGPASKIRKTQLDVRCFFVNLVFMQLIIVTRLEFSEYSSCYITVEFIGRSRRYLDNDSPIGGQWRCAIVFGLQDHVYRPWMVRHWKHHFRLHSGGFGEARLI